MSSVRMIETTPRALTGFAGPAASRGLWRHCEYCGCKSNAQERMCCTRGRTTDRNTWDKSALDE